MKQHLSMKEAATNVAYAIKQKTPVAFFVGAGISMRDPSFLPDWTKFRNAMVSALVDRLSITGYITVEDNTAIKNDFLEYDSRYGSLRSGLWLKPEVVLQWLHNYIPNIVFKMLGIFASGHPNKNHLTLAHIAAQSDALLATCNFDTHIKHAVETIGFITRRFAAIRTSGDCRSFREYLTYTKQAHNGIIPILKIHGCITAPRTIRATVKQVSRPMPWAEKESLRHLLRNRLLIVAGYSGRDSDIRDVFETYANSSKNLLWLARSQKSVIPDVSRIPNTTFGFGDINTFFTTLAKILRIPLSTKKGRPVSVSNHAESAAKNASYIRTSLGLSELASHIGCRKTVEILTQRIIRSSRNPRWLAQAWMALGDSKRRTSPNEAFQCFEQAETLAKLSREHDPLMYGHSLKYLSAQHYVLGSLDNALKLNTKSLKWVRRSGDQFTEGRVLDDRAIFYRQKGNINYAIKLRKRAIVLLEKDGDMISLAMVYNNLGKDYDFQDNFKEAERWWRKSLKLKEKETSNSPDIGRTCFNIGELLRHTGNTKEAVPFLARAIDRAKMHDDRIIQARALFSMAAVVFSNGKAEQARRLLKLAATKAAATDDWQSSPGRLEWAQEIEKMIAGSPKA